LGLADNRSVLLFVITLILILSIPMTSRASAAVDAFDVFTTPIANGDQLEIKDTVPFPAHSFFDVFVDIPLGNPPPNPQETDANGNFDIFVDTPNTDPCGKHTVTITDTNNIVLATHTFTLSTGCTSGPSIPDFPFSYSLIIMFVAVAAVYLGIRQKMIPGTGINLFF